MKTKEERLEYQKEYRKNNKEKIKERERGSKAEWNKKYQSSEKGINTIRGAHLKRTYGIDLLIYETLLNKQGGKCGICGSDGNGNKRARHLVVDHDHMTGDVRGLLCTQCNSMIGLALDRVDILQKAQQYLINNSKINTIFNNQ